MIKSLLPLSLKAVHDENVITLHKAGLVSASAIVVPRAQCHFERMWTPRVDQKGVDAVKLSVAQDTQYDAPGIFVEPTDATDATFVNCWVWDNDIATKIVGRNALLIPETFARQSMFSGARLTHCLYGFEGQVWEQNRLIATRWWRTEPNELDWAQFIEGSEVTVGAFTSQLDDIRRKPEPQHVAWREDISLIDFGSSAIETTISPLRAFAVAAIVLSLPFGYLAGSALKLNQEVSSATAKLERLQIELGDVADARRTAIANRAVINTYQAGGDPFRAVNVLEEFGLATDPSQVTIRQMSYNRDAIELRFSADARMLLPDLIRKLELSPHWESASATTNTNGEIVVRGRLIPTGGGS